MADVPKAAMPRWSQGEGQGGTRWWQRAVTGTLGTTNEQDEQQRRQQQQQGRQGSAALQRIAASVRSARGTSPSPAPGPEP